MPNNYEFVPEHLKYYNHPQKKSRYNWIRVDERMPQRDPDNPDETIVVLVRAFGMSWHKSKAFYSYETKKWHTVKSGNPMNSDVIYWVPLEEENVEK